MMTSTATPVTYGCDPSIFKFSVTRYQRMIDLGIVTAEDQFELLENYVLLKIPHDPPHDGTLDVVSGTMGSVLPAGWFQREQKAVALSDSQPEPDDAIVRGNRRSYLARHPGPADIGLIIEVADSSLLRDQHDKTRIYARAGIVCYWIINLVDRRVEVYTQPSGPTAVPAYGSFQTYQPGDNVPLVLDGNTVANVAVNELLP